MAENTTLQKRLESYMQAHGLKSTRQRQVILETFLDSRDHVALDELLEQVQLRMSGVGYATVYRTMKLLVDADVALERNFGDGQSRYEAVTPEEDHHDHLICRLCGTIIEFEDGVIEARQDHIAHEHGMRIVAHRLDIWGECLDAAACAARRGRP